MADAATTLTLSRLPKTWLIDVDGVCLAHNGHLRADERLLPGVREFWAGLGADDMVILLSAREESWRAPTLALFADLGLRVDQALFGLPVGERILINDKKPGGLLTAHAVNLARDAGLESVRIDLDPTL
ncbi:hypothetical protein [Roseospirillum parvum]|uniref:Uncharacterized protein n=1 Tax=Roseospirillum parvum TaxID=83401 RepID=A0A1G7UP02_9PROT|nr:hypothetical protein [Roseospirillum parvum]SDG49244.1 hypothetical protein SAMN05421742_101389 [Roseospirillum parvum]